MRRATPLLLAALLAWPPALCSQSVLGHSPNLRGEWSAGPWATAFVLGHRFEFISGGDELINIPTLTFGMGLPAEFTLGVDFTSNSEIVPARLGGNETQLWLGRSVLRAGPHQLGALIAYNRAARSVDGALTARVRLAPVSLLGELRGFGNALGSGSSGTAVAGGAVLHLTQHLALSADVARMLRPHELRTVWSAGAGVAIPGTPHTFSVHATNSGATTLQGASIPKVIGPQATRYGFTFTVPLGSRAQWARIFRSAPAVAEHADSVPTIEMRMVAFTPREVRVRVGERVVWRNMDPVEHTITALDRSWTSPLLQEGARYERVFTTPGRYEYFCDPHPQMTGVIIVEPSD